MHNAAIESTLISIRAFDDFCRNKREHADDLLAGDFPDLSIGNRFLDLADRRRINKQVAHLTHVSVGQATSSYHYREFLSAAIPRARQFCHYSESDTVNPELSCESNRKVRESTQHREVGGTVTADTNDVNPDHTQLLAVKWADEQLRQMKNPTEFTVHNLFAVLMYTASKFVIADVDKVETNELNETGLFEFCCYLHSAVDLWLFTNMPKLRERISGGFYDKFVNLYSTIFDMEKPSIGRLLNQRLTKYGELYRSDFPDMKNALWNLSQAVMTSKRKAKPEPYDFEKGPVIHNAFEDFRIQTSFQLWFIHVFPVYIKDLEVALRIVE